MDEDMRRRIREKGGDPDEKATNWFKKKKNAAQASAKGTVRRIIDNSRRRQQSLYDDRMLSDMRFRLYLKPVERRLSNIFSSEQAKKFRIASAFSMDIHSINSPGYVDVPQDGFGTFVRPTEIPSYYRKGWVNSFLVIKFNSRAGIAIDFAPSENCDSLSDFGQYTYKVKGISFEGFKLVDSLIFISRNGWHTNVWEGPEFQNEDELVEYIKDAIARAIIDNNNQFVPRLAKRGLKLIVAVGLAAVFVRACVPAFGAERQQPVNDFGVPEEPKIGYSDLTRG